MITRDEDERPLDDLLRAVRSESAPADLDERVLADIAYRTRLAELAAPPRHFARSALLFSGIAIAAGVGLLLGLRGSGRDLPIAAEPADARRTEARAPSGSAAQPPPAMPDPCRTHESALGNEPSIDDFEDGDDAILPREGRAGFWRWAREIDAPGTAPALMPVPRPDGTRANRLAQHIKGGELVDWGALLEFDFRPPCYDASKYAGVSFQARGPGRIYVAPREVSIIPVVEGGTCERDCHNPHVLKIDLEPNWHVYQVHWSDVRQRGFGKLPLNPKRLNSLAFIVRPEDTPYDVWIDDVRFLQR